ncbi:MAG: hypothetical protein KH415_23025 [Clostridium sp.]|nr:hypothetical protein [Clostridium sp.]
MNRKRIRKLIEDYDYEEVYAKQIKNLEEYEDLRTNKNYVYMVKTITSGKYVEKEIYPLWKCKSKSPRGAKTKETTDKMKKLNTNNKAKEMTRLMNTNFTEEDLYITLTYKGKPPTLDRAKKDMRNFLDRIRTWWKKNKPKEEFKYIYVIDYVDDPDKTKRTRIHHHLVMSGMDMDVVRKNWKLGRKTVERLQPDEVGFEGLATYMARQSKTKYGRSRNLKKPKITKSRTSLSNRKAESLGMDVNMHKEFFEGKYKDLLFIGCEVYKSKDYPGVYIRTKMRKRE